MILARLKLIDTLELKLQEQAKRTALLERRLEPTPERSKLIQSLEQRIQDSAEKVAQLERLLAQLVEDFAVKSKAEAENASNDPKWKDEKNGETGTAPEEI